MKKIKLLAYALFTFCFGFLLIAAMLFLPAMSFRYWNGWLFLGLLFIPMFLLGTVLFVKSPDLLKKRLENKEKEAEQKTVVAASALMFIGGFVVAGLDYRFGWSRVPFWVVITASVLLLTSYGLYCEVMRENAYLSRTIEVQEGQKVVNTGLYGIVRHPMYMTTVFLFLSIPLVLGSWYALIIFLIYPFLLIKRIRNEEKVLLEGLEGYGDYMKKVKYRMIPFIW